MAQDEEKNKYFYFATGPVKPGVSDTMSGIVRGDVNLLNGRLEGVLCVMVNFGENFAPVSDHVSIFPTFWMEIKTLESFNKNERKIY